MLLERDITAAIIDYLLLKGAWVFKTHGHLGQRKGILDILACLDGRFVGIEVKKPGGKVSGWQQAEIEAIKRAGGVAFVAWNVDEVMQKLPGNVA